MHHCNAIHAASAGVAAAVEKQGSAHLAASAFSDLQATGDWTVAVGVDMEWVSVSFHICSLPAHTLMFAPAAATAAAAAASAMLTRCRTHADADAPPSAAVSDRAAKKAKHTLPPHYPARGASPIHRWLCVCL